MSLLKKIATGLGFLGPVYRGKPGMRAYAIGDVHGCLAQLNAMLDHIERDVSDYAGKAYLILLGDVVDRGPDSRGVIERLRTYQHPALRKVMLMGNHEEFLLRALDGEAGTLRRWLEFGGAECVASYGLSAHRLLAAEEDDAVAMLRNAIPAAHIAFLSEFGDTLRFGDYLFVHAGIRPGLALDQQSHADLRWIRDPFLTHRGDYGFMVVHGHTITDTVDEQANRIGIDTGTYRGGPLTALVVENTERRYLSIGGQSGGGLP